MSHKLWILISIALFSLSSLAQADDTIQVQASGTAQGVPDTIQFSLWVEAEGGKLSPLKTRADQITETILRDLQQRDVAREDMSSYQLRIQPQYERHNNQTRQKGFLVSRQIQITLRNTDDFDHLIDFALAQGVTRVGQINYIIADSSELAQQALLNAVDEAHNKAQLMAKHSNRELGDIVNIRELSEGGGPGLFMRAESSAINLSEPGQQEVTARIEVTFRLQ
ncbi:hypothetical protein CWE09_05240 [Aliidiomarina minuta]|uniref:SIMPL domain-containing protein n=1 Tax=Aliidiomarina minuta TaxID=880057 RepID=A0A432W7X8_9GAMM|nr:SIMPL domain-containing protein [Aliidiomarina minuta]RUO26129.1 hypothetical protein CWE09_05240 [Aliidiomarina minuta]